MAVIIGSVGKNITPQQMIAQWRHLPHKFQINLWNFEVKAGKLAVSIFQESFELKRFNSSGSMAWKPRSPKNKKLHPLMTESFSLKKSIKWKHLGKRGAASGVTIYTDPNGFNNTFSHRGFCFAAVHNAPDSLGTRTGHMKNMPQRQFMGHSSVLKEELKKLSVMIFQGFPK